MTNEISQMMNVQKIVDDYTAKPIVEVVKKFRCACNAEFTCYTCDKRNQDWLRLDGIELKKVLNDDGTVDWVTPEGKLLSNGMTVIFHGGTND